ncbi:MAG: hypothetical protein ACRDAQ_03920 [Cetobacterium sp.]
MTKDFDYIEELNKDVYKMGTKEIGKFGFFNKNNSIEEIYEDIIKLSDQYYLGRLADFSDIIDFEGEIIRLKNEDLKEYIENILK